MHTIKLIRPKHYAGRCYGFSIWDGNKSFHIDATTLYDALVGVELRYLKERPTTAKDGTELYKETSNAC